MYRIGLAFAAMALAAGAVFLGLAVYYVAAYAFDAGNPLRHESLFGAALALMYSAGSSLAASVAAGLLRSRLPELAFRWLAWPGLLIGAGLLCLYIVSLGWTWIARTS
jgi:hypothetical protein